MHTEMGHGTRPSTTVASGTGKTRDKSDESPGHHEETNVAESTKRGEEDRKREDEEVQGQPVATAADRPGTRAANTTRDKGVEPSEDNERDGRGEGK